MSQGRTLVLPPKQHALFCLLAGEPGRVFDDREIIEQLWPTSTYANSGDVRQCIYLLRRSLSELAAEPAKVIANVKGHGYTFVPPTRT